jgi:hypothetical protein
VIDPSGNGELVVAGPFDLRERTGEGGDLGQGRTDFLDRSGVDPMGRDKGIQNGDMRWNSGGGMVQSPSKAPDRSLRGGHRSDDAVTPASQPISACIFLTTHLK